jgi:hypothetical protein
VTTCTGHHAIMFMYNIDTEKRNISLYCCMVLMKGLPLNSHIVTLDSEQNNRQGRTTVCPFIVEPSV